MRIGGGEASSIQTKYRLPSNPFSVVPSQLPPSEGQDNPQLLQSCCLEILTDSFKKKNDGKDTGLLVGFTKHHRDSAKEKLLFKNSSSPGAWTNNELIQLF